MEFWEKIFGFVFGIIFIIVLLIITLVIPDPTETQYATFKTILALSAAGIGGILSGFIHVEGKLPQITIRAGGALALFVIVYFFAPAPATFTNEEVTIKSISTEVSNEKNSENAQSILGR